MYLKIYDTGFESVEAWQREFEKNQTVLLARAVTWEEMQAKQLTYGPPKRILTVAVENGIIYTLDSPDDSQDFWGKTHELILNSFQFDEEPINQEAGTKTETGSDDEEPDIILIEETIE